MGCAIFGDVETAFSFGGFFPPPASCAFMFAGCGGSRARFATDGDKAFCVEWVIGDVVCVDVVPDLL